MSGKTHHRKPRTASHSDAKPAHTQPIEEMVQAREPEVLKAAAAHPAMTEDLALAFLTRRRSLFTIPKAARRDHASRARSWACCRRVCAAAPT